MNTSQKQNSHESVSGKGRFGNWLNKKWLRWQQRVIQSHGLIQEDKPGETNLYGRSDLDEQNESARETDLNAKSGNESMTAYLSEILVRSPEVDMTAIDLNYDDGVVILTGYVNTLAEKEVVEKVVLNTPEVHDVINRIQVRSKEQGPIIERNPKTPLDPFLH